MFLVCISKGGFHTVYCFELEKSCMVLFGLFMKFQIKENEELTSICDELIAKVGSWNSIITISWHMLMPHGHFIGERNIPTKFHVNWFRIGESNDNKCKIEIYKYGWRYICWKNCCSSWKKCLKNHWCTCSYKPPMIFTPAF